MSNKLPFARSAKRLLARALADYPVVALTGARQVGKSTLLRTTLPDWRFVSLEDPDVREFSVASTLSRVNFRKSIEGLQCILGQGNRTADKIARAEGQIVELGVRPGNGCIPWPECSAVRVDTLLSKSLRKR